MTQKENYIEFHIDIRTDVKWHRMLERLLKRKSRRWIFKDFHITAAFMNDNQLKDKLTEELDKVLKGLKAPQLTFDKLEVFTNKKKTDHIVCLTSSKPEEGYINLKDKIRNKATEIGAILQDYQLHVTLAYIDVNTMNLNEIKLILNKISIPAFTLTIKSIDYRYRGKDRDKNLIRHWDLGLSNTKYKSSI